MVLLMLYLLADLPSRCFTFIQSEELTFPAITVELSISPCNSVRVFIYFDSLLAWLL